MDISTATSTTASTTAVAETSSRQQTQKSSDKSFSEEMSKVETKSDKKADTKQVKSDKKTEAKEETTATDSQKQDVQQNENKVANNAQDLSQATMMTGEISMAENMLGQNFGMQPDMQFAMDNIDTVQTLLDANRQLASITRETNIPTKVDYTTVQMDTDDAKFFSDLVKDTDATLQNVVNELQKGAEPEVQAASKNVKVSATLMNALSEATKTNQPFRIDFDNDISIIIKVDKDGSLSAKFIPGDKAVEQYLKQNISTLQQRFDEQELSYKELSYSNQQQRRNKQNNKENSHE